MESTPTIIAKNVSGIKSVQDVYQTATKSCSRVVADSGTYLVLHLRLRPEQVKSAFAAHYFLLQKYQQLGETSHFLRPVDIDLTFSPIGPVSHHLFAVPADLSPVSSADPKLVLPVMRSMVEMLSDATVHPLVVGRLSPSLFWFSQINNRIRVYLDITDGEALECENPGGDTLYYPPEVLAELESHHSAKLLGQTGTILVFSVGVLLYQLLFHKSSLDLRNEISWKLQLSREKYEDTIVKPLTDTVKMGSGAHSPLVGLKFMAAKALAFCPEDRPKLEKLREILMRFQDEGSPKTFSAGAETLSQFLYYAYPYSDSLFMYSLHGQTLHKLTLPLYVLDGFETVPSYADSTIFFLGGRYANDDYVTKMSVVKISFIELKCESVLTRPGPTVPRCWLRARWHHNVLYAVGGYRDGEYLDTCERYDPAAASGQWELVSPLQEGKFGVELVSLGEYLYAFGGYQHFTFLDTIERYNEELGEEHGWKIIDYVAAMVEPNFGHHWSAAIQIGEHEAMIIGGYAGKTKGETYVFNASTKVLSRAEDLCAPAWFCQRMACRSADGGSFSVMDWSANVHTYNVAEKKWTMKVPAVNYT